MFRWRFKGLVIWSYYIEGNQMSCIHYPIKFQITIIFEPLEGKALLPCISSGGD